MGHHLCDCNGRSKIWADFGTGVKKCEKWNESHDKWNESLFGISILERSKIKVHSQLLHTNSRNMNNSACALVYLDELPLSPSTFLSFNIPPIGTFHPFFLSHPTLSSFHTVYLHLVFSTHVWMEGSWKRERLLPSPPPHPYDGEWIGGIMWDTRPNMWDRIDH